MKISGRLISLALLVTSLTIGGAVSAEASTPKPLSQTPVIAYSQISIPDSGAGEAVDTTSDTQKPSILKWICKVGVTLVSTAAWVMVVVESEGTLLLVARQIVKYVSVPTFICSWL